MHTSREVEHTFFTQVVIQRLTGRKTAVKVRVVCISGYGWRLGAVRFIGREGV